MDTRQGIAALILLAGCTHAGPDKWEYGRVMKAGYTPGQHLHGWAYGKQLNYVSGETDERFFLLIRCQHGQFVTTSEGLFHAAAEGDSVRILYHENLDDDGNVKSYSTEDIQPVRLR